MRRALEALVMERQTEGKTQFPPFFQKLIDQGKQEARAEAHAEEATRALLTVLRARGLAVPDAVHERILAEKDLARLERWIERAAVAGSVADAIEDPS
jgi:hypothetical protein